VGLPHCQHSATSRWLLKCTRTLSPAAFKLDSQNISFCRHNSTTDSEENEIVLFKTFLSFKISDELDVDVFGR
jgi:hypothetical protein